jgi:hypothetical protein
MAGLIPHLIAGSAVYLISRYSFRTFFNGPQKKKERLLLLFICLFFSMIPDVFLAIYYVANPIPIETHAPFQINTQFHMIIVPITIVVSLFLIIIDSKRKPIWLFGICAVILHIIMDQLILEHGFFF